jgi:uncharacterized protein YndB with AHSA1/START domain
VPVPRSLEEEDAVRPVTGTVDIARPARAVFRYIADASHLPEWQPDVVQAQLTAGGRVRVGTPGQETRRVGRALRTIPWTVSDYERGRRWGVQVTEGPLRTHVTMDLTPVPGTRTTRLDYCIDLGGRGLGVVLAALLHRGLRRTVPRNLDRLRQRLEQPGRSSSAGA